MKWRPKANTAPAPTIDPAQRNVETIARLEQTAQAPRSLTEWVVERVSLFVGSSGFLYAHLCWFVSWPLVNLLPGIHHFDPYPFPLLGLLLCMEAILLATLIVMSQNRQQRLADRRAHLDLQVNLLAEQETTKVLAMLETIEQHLGIARHDPEVAALKEATEPERLVEQIESQVERQESEASGA